MTDRRLVLRAGVRFRVGLTKSNDTVRAFFVSPGRRTIFHHVPNFRHHQLRTRGLLGPSFPQQPGWPTGMQFPLFSTWLRKNWKMPTFFKSLETPRVENARVGKLEWYSDFTGTTFAAKTCWSQCSDPRLVVLTQLYQSPVSYTFLKSIPKPLAKSSMVYARCGSVYFELAELTQKRF